MKHLIFLDACLNVLFCFHAGAEVAVLCITKSGEVLSYQAFTDAKGKYAVAETMPESDRWDACLADWHGLLAVSMNTAPVYEKAALGSSSPTITPRVTFTPSDLSSIDMLVVSRQPTASEVEKSLK